MNTPTFVVKQPLGDEGPQQFYVNGTQVGEVNHDSHGWAGMEAARNMFEEIAAQLDVQVMTVNGDNEWI